MKCVYIVEPYLNHTNILKPDFSTQLSKMSQSLISLSWLALYSGAYAQSISPLSENLSLNVNNTIAHPLLTCRFKSGGIQISDCKHVSCAVKRYVLQNIFLLSRDVTGDVSIIAAAAARLSQTETIISVQFPFVFHHKTAAAKNIHLKNVLQINSTLKGEI